MRLLKDIHVGVSVKFEVDGITHEVTYTIDVKKGDILGPVLSIIFMTGVMLTRRKSAADCPPLIF